MDWVVGITTIVCLELTIRKKWWAFLLALGNQFLWTAFIVSERQWGLLPLNLTMYVMNARAAYTWYHLDKEGNL